MMMLMRPMTYSKVPYFLFLMNTFPSTLKTFLVVVKVNLGLLTGRNYLVDQISEAENFHPSSIPEITKIITNLSIATVLAGIISQQLFLNTLSGRTGSALVWYSEGRRFAPHSVQ